jgi:hypothetical protein
MKRKNKKFKKLKFFQIIERKMMITTKPHPTRRIKGRFKRGKIQNEMLLALVVVVPGALSEEALVGFR